MSSIGIDLFTPQYMYTSSLYFCFILLITSTSLVVPIWVNCLLGPEKAIPAIKVKGAGRAALFATLTRAAICLYVGLLSVIWLFQ